ncbi:hypothetical protein N8I77_008597 [Diaporthe amygdali]|uniref:Major facilitator superfamily (MFS) profile domain-containing protein n=1 Tax=Phomopsis amygdali TaxID=1214568 RepID=A0AAD9W2J4_PHOAM|nr:hypothetical protein N8I77_008597 [Diaporthe amygdali]
MSFQDQTQEGGESVLGPLDLNVQKPSSDKKDNHRAVEPHYAEGFKLFLIMLSINMAALLTALEIGIISTAIPQITDEFHSLSDVGWYGSATFFIVAATSASWGKLYKYCNAKWVFLSSLAFIMIGSIPAAAAPNSRSIILGRAIQGLGIAGSMSGSIIVINFVSHPSQHPLLIGIWTGVFMVSTILGPIIGGAFTSGASWRWCFWINLPLGFPIITLLVLLLHIPEHIKPAPGTWKEILMQLDFPGLFALLASLVCLTLAMEWGGQTKAWSDGPVIATLIMSIVLFMGFFIYNTLFPADWLIHNSVYSSNAAFYQVMFYLPIYFQSIKGQSAIMSGVYTLPYLAFFALGAVCSGTLIGYTRYLMPYQLVSTLLMTAGMALLYIFDVETPKAWYVGAQVLFGFGVGFGNQVPVTAVQGLSKPEDVPSSTALMFSGQTACQSSAGAVFIVVAQAIFANRLLHTIATTAPNLDPAIVLGIGASEIRNVFNAADLDHVMNAYMVGIRDPFVCSLAGAALSVLISLLIPLKRLPDHINGTGMLADLESRETEVR